MIVVVTTNLGNEQYGMEKIERALVLMAVPIRERGFLVVLADDTDLQSLLKRLGPGFSIHTADRRIERQD